MNREQLIKRIGGSVSSKPHVNTVRKGGFVIESIIMGAIMEDFNKQKALHEAKIAEDKARLVALEAALPKEGGMVDLLKQGAEGVINLAGTFLEQPEMIEGIKSRAAEHAEVLAKIAALEALDKRAGEGIMDNIGLVLSSAVRKGSPPAFRETLKRFQDQKIIKMSIVRAPVASAIKSVMGFLTAGKFNKTMKDFDYSDIFHLSAEMALENGTELRLEKNEVAILETVTEATRVTGPRVERVNVVLKDGPINLRDYILTTEKAMGERYWLYSADVDNCQAFIWAHLYANGIDTPELHKYIIQDAYALMQKEPAIAKFLSTLTDLGGVMNRIKHGDGVAKVGGDIGDFFSGLLNFISGLVGKKKADPVAQDSGKPKTQSQEAAAIREAAARTGSARLGQKDFSAAAQAKTKQANDKMDADGRAVYNFVAGKK